MGVIHHGTAERQRGEHADYRFMLAEFMIVPFFKGMSSELRGVQAKQANTGLQCSAAKHVGLQALNIPLQLN